MGFYKEIVAHKLDFAYLSRRHNLFMDDLKQYQESHKVLNDVIEIIVQASRGTGSCYGVSKCAEIVFKH